MTGPNQMRYEAHIEDPKVLTRPRTVVGTYNRVAGEVGRPADDYREGTSYFRDRPSSHCALYAVPVFADHAFSAEFDAKQPVTLSDTIAKVEWINPHPWLHIDVKGPHGAVTQGAVEMGAPSTLIRRGWSKDSLPIGGEITVKGYRAKDGSNRANGSIGTVNGKSLFVGSSGTGASDEPKQATRGDITS